VDEQAGEMGEIFVCKVKGDWTLDRAELKDADGWGGTACWPIHPPKNSRRDGLLGDVGVPAEPGHVAALRRKPRHPHQLRGLWRREAEDARLAAAALNLSSSALTGAAPVRPRRREAA
jgi:hypothetical protein